MVFEKMVGPGHEQVCFVSDESVGLRSIIAIHDTTLGPALGGTRLRPYSSEEEALTDVLRLAAGMTYKAAAADLNLGGGKAVILADSDEKTPAMFRRFGSFVDRFGGQYITSVDMNTTIADMEAVATQTDHVVALEDGLGDPSPVTATGVLTGIEACTEWVYGSPSVENKRVVLQGIGKVGSRLAERLVDAGAEVFLSDVNMDQATALADDLGADTVAPEDVYGFDCDIFSPNAVGGVLNDDTVPQLTCDIVAGGANNVLRADRHAEQLRNRDILYAPDFVINAGGLITVAAEAEGGTKRQAFADARRIGDRLLTMFEQAETEDITVLEAARQYATDRIERHRQPASQLSD